MIPSVVLTLPYPPSGNHRNATRNGQYFHTARYKAFRQQVAVLVIQSGVSFGPELLKVSIDAYPPDARRRDLDNIIKPTLDALEAAGAFDDDGQICDLRVRRMNKVKGGSLAVMIQLHAKGA